MQLEIALSKFLLQLEADGRSEHTRKQYRRHVQALGTWLGRERGGQDLGLVGHEDVAEFLASPAARLRPDGVSKKATSVNALRSSLRSFFGYLHAAGYLATHPARLVRRARCTPPPPRALSEGEERRLLAAIDEFEEPEAHRDAVLFQLMLLTGLRLGSALALDIAHLDLDEGVAVIHAKGDRAERVFLPVTARAQLAELIGERRSGPVFRGRGGRRLSTRHVQRRFARVREWGGLPASVTCHSLRHTFGSRLLERTGDIELVRRALTHRSLACTQVYARCGDRRLRAAIGA